MHIFAATPETLAGFCSDRGMPRYVADQILDWVYAKGVTDPSLMTNIAARFREVLLKEAVFSSGRVVRHHHATDGTQKLLMSWNDSEAGAVADAARAEIGRALPVLDEGSGRETECVMIPTEQRNTACVSSQVGCPVGCRFCASGLGGLDGNLMAGQIVEQVYRLGRLEGVDRITNVVFMGMGEPLANYGAVTDAIRTINAPWGLGISARKITVSTVGLPAAIRKFTSFELPVTLALSLHAPNDVLRRELIPWANYATIDELLDACDEYFQKTGREITLEYLLLRNVNDRPEHARELSGLATRLRANVNLIRYNEVRGLPYDRPTSDDVRAFQAILKGQGVNTHLRASRGRDIAAACGQLRHEHVQGRV